MTNPRAAYPSAYPSSCEGFVRRVRSTPDAVALRRADGMPLSTWAQLDVAAQRMAAGLEQAGAGRAASLVVMSSNRLEVYAAFLAAMRLGAAFMPLSGSVPECELDAVLRAVATSVDPSARPPVVLCEAQFAQRLDDAGAPFHQAVVFDTDRSESPENTVPLDELVPPGEDSATAVGAGRPSESGTVAVIAWSVGVGARTWSHDELAERIRGQAAAQGIGDEAHARSFIAEPGFEPQDGLADWLSAAGLLGVLGAEITVIADPAADAAMARYARPPIWPSRRAATERGPGL